MNIEIESHVLIDISEIWNAELERYAKEKTNRDWHDELYNYLKYFYIQKQHKPFIDFEEVNGNKNLEAYYLNYQKRLERYEINGQLDFFEYKNSFYDMNEHCIIEKDEVTLEVYQKLFAIKLKQLEENQELLIYFIHFHFYNTFHKDISRYNSFLSALQLKKDIISPNLFLAINGWKLTANHLLEEGLFQEEKEERLEGDFFIELPNDTNKEELDLIEVALLNNQKGNEFTQEEKIHVDIELQSTKIDGAFSLEEILHYFSFLYQDKGIPDGSFLTREEVEIVFKDGIVLPPKPLTEKFKLNYTPRYTKKLVDYFIYKFIQHYNVKAKRQILVFFGNYIEDYANALDQRKLENLNKNITGDKPRNLFFNEKDFLPERFY